MGRGLGRWPADRVVDRTQRRVSRRGRAQSRGLAWRGQGWPPSVPLALSPESL